MPSPEPEELTPDWSLHPGIVLRHILEQRGIRQSELAERTGLTPKHINQLVNEGIGISGDVALLLERALPGFDARFWARADAYHQAYLSREKAREALPQLNAWADNFDPGTLRHHGITGPQDDQATRVEKILQFFEVASPAAFEKVWLLPRVSFRRSQAFTVAEENTALWLRLLDRNAQAVTVDPFRPGALRKAARTIPTMTNLTITDGFTAARAALAQAGVVLTFIRQVPGTRISGATWWLAADRPVIGLTEQHRKPDIFWFNLLHEIGHIALHPRRTTFLDLDLDKATRDAEEQRADAFAEDILLPGDTRTQIARATSREELLLLAVRLGIGVTIVAGQHGHATGQWNIGGTLRGKITDADIDALEALSSTSG